MAQLSMLFQFEKLKTKIIPFLNVQICVPQKLFIHVNNHVFFIIREFRSLKMDKGI